MANKGKPTKWTKERIEKERKALGKYIKNTPLPLLYEFAVSRDYSHQRLSEWAHDSQAVSDTIKKCKDKATAELIRGGMSKKYEIAMAIFCLKNIAGWRDKQELTGDSGKPINIIFEGIKDLPGK